MHEGRGLTLEAAPISSPNARGPGRPKENFPLWARAGGAESLRAVEAKEGVHLHRLG